MLAESWVLGEEWRRVSYRQCHVSSCVFIKGLPQMLSLTPSKILERTAGSIFRAVQPPLHPKHQKDGRERERQKKGTCKNWKSADNDKAVMEKEGGIYAMFCSRSWLKVYKLHKVNTLGGCGKHCQVAADL